MEITRIEPGARMSQAVVHGGTVYLAGQVGEGETVAEQTASALSQVDALLASAGTDKTRLLTATIFLPDMASFDDMNAVWEAWVTPGHTPARATVEAKLATPAYAVEIVVIAAV